MFNLGKMIFRSLAGKPATEKFPFEPRVYFEQTRGSIDIDVNSCILCGICQKKCPADAITVDRNNRTWEIERMQCIQCSNCILVCPKKCLTNNNQYTTPSTAKTVDTFNIPQQEKAAASGKLKVDKETCIYCGICQKQCPQEAITVDRKADPKVWEVDTEKCTKCGLCIEKCPKKSLEFK
jgi:formate hydrogenlyase subunit 6/NADH:ubiquinone oxidoreductase subunit I